MKQYRTAQGKIVDMSALAAKNERMRAVGNMKVNARGDTIDGNGKIVVPVTQKVGDNYQKTVGNRSAHSRKAAPKQAAPAAPKQAQPAPPKAEEQLTREEIELESSFDDDYEVEQIKAKETKK